MSSNNRTRRKTEKPSVTSSVEVDSTEPRDGGQLGEQLEFFFQAANIEFGDEHKNHPKRPEERGLPSDEALREFAETYLETQHRLWPGKLKSDQGWISPIVFSSSFVIFDFASNFRSILSLLFDHCSSHVPTLAHISLDEFLVMRLIHLQ